MKLPWDRNYIKISFHVIVTMLVLGVAIIVMTKLPELTYYLGMGISGLFSLAAPLIIGIVIAFLFDPLVDFFNRPFEKKRLHQRFKSRRAGAVICYAVVFVVIGGLVGLGIKNVGSTDIDQFSDVINTYINDLSNMLLGFQQKISVMGIFSTVNGVINNVIMNLTRFATSTVATVVSKITSIGSIVVNLFVGLVVAFYFLLEKERILFRLREILEVVCPRDMSEDICNFFKDVSEVFSGYVTGQMIDAVIMGSLVIISFWIAGIEHAILIGFVSGLCNLIPYVGAVVGFVLAVMVGLISGTPAKALYAAIIIVVIQQIDSMIIVPKVVGERVKLHPVLVILALSMFGRLFGLPGMLLAVPITALMKKFFDRGINKRKTKTCK